MFPFSSQRGDLQRSQLLGHPFPLLQPCATDFEDPFDLYARLTNCAPHSFFIEQEIGKAGNSCRFSYFGCDPYRILLGKGSTLRSCQSGIWTEEVGEPFASFQRLFDHPPLLEMSSFLPFSGGAIGCFSYDLVRRFEELPEDARDDLAFPDLYFLFVEVFVAVDHQTRGVWLVFAPSPERVRRESLDSIVQYGHDHLSDLALKLKNTSTRRKVGTINTKRLGIRGEQTPTEYKERVRQTQEYISAGDIYQANISHRFHIQGLTHSPAGEAAELYRKLRRVNPSPHSAFLVLESQTVVCNSPERLVRLSNRVADLRPIAGTRPRGEEKAKDRKLAEDLLTSSKERAEHLMLVDLARNDLGRVCEYGSIQVDEFMTVERYSHVMHLVSNVSGHIRDDSTGFDLLRAVFPGGTITGAPKIHCMEVIERLEPVRRGIYTGSIGFIGWDGNLDFNIAIRTLLLTKLGGFLQVGAGIVADSDPDREYEETVHKAKAFFQILEYDQGS